MLHRQTSLLSDEPLTCSKGTLRAKSLMRSRALTMMYGSQVFLVVATLILPSIRSKLHEILYSHRQHHSHLEHICHVGVALYLSFENPLNVRPDLLQVLLTIFGEQSGKTTLLSQWLRHVTFLELIYVPMVYGLAVPC